jgi:hypothetical protein
MVIAEAGNQAATAPENGAQMDNRWYEVQQEDTEKLKTETEEPPISHARGEVVGSNIISNLSTGGLRRTR